MICLRVILHSVWWIKLKKVYVINGKWLLKFHEFWAWNCQALAEKEIFRYKNFASCPVDNNRFPNWVWKWIPTLIKFPQTLTQKKIQLKIAIYISIFQQFRSQNNRLQVFHLQTHFFVQFLVRVLFVATSATFMSR